MTRCETTGICLIFLETQWDDFRLVFICLVADLHVNRYGYYLIFVP